MAAVPEAASPQVVSELVAAFRLELAYWIPVLLSPLVEELKELKNGDQSRGSDSRSVPSTAQALPRAWSNLSTCDERPTGPVSAVDSAFSSGIASPGAASATAGAATLAHEKTIAPTNFGDRALEAYPNGGLQDTVAGDQHGRIDPADIQAIDVSRATMGSDIEMSTPFIDPAGQTRSSAFRWSWSLLWGQKYSAREGYHLTPRCENIDEPVTYSNMMDADMSDNDGVEITDPEAAKRLPREIASLEEKAQAASESLDDLDTLWKNRRRPYEEDIAGVRNDIEKLQDQLEMARVPKNTDPPPPGPAALQCVDSTGFTLVCNLVVLLNLTCMVMAPRWKKYALLLKVADHVFLAWYVVELSVKAVYYQRYFILGRISVVWWNWLDLGIVISGVVDQWLLPLLTALNGGHLDIDTSALRMLRILRLFRIMRFLKIIKAFLKSDFAWTEGGFFESLMASVIGFNSVVMSIELDVPWVGWHYVENGLQVVYAFELACRLKRQCCRFFIDPENLGWNWLDFIMVSGGALDLWLVPLIYELREFFFGISASNNSSSLSEVLKILKIMRILRVLRLVRLLKMVHPLYKLLMGVIASVKAMQWVLVLTLMTLYACSIVFTNLVGKGLMSGGDVSGSAEMYFGTVPSSLFSLFKLMNGDMSVVAPITGSIMGQLLFAGFMVVSNWAILAVLTAVVSDNMITTSQKANEEDDQVKAELDYQRRIRRLTTLFSEIDHDGEGTISTTEWQRMMDDRSLQRELSDASGLKPEDLNDYFDCLAKDPKQQERDKLRKSGQMTDLSLDYNTFMEALKDEGALADKRSILHVLKQVRVLETQVKREFEELGKSNFRGSMLK